MGVVLFTNDSNRGQALAHLIVRAGIDLTLVVVENPSLREPRSNPFVQFLRLNLVKPYRWIKHTFLTKPEDKKALNYEVQSLQIANAVVDDYILALGVKGRPEGVDYLETPKLNEATVITAVKRAKPDVCVVLGTSILKKTLISIPKIGTINAHTSILPEYRGSKSEFWQCYNNDYSNVGMTLHLIDKGVDTGNILFQKKQEVKDNPDPNMLRAINTLATLKNYVPVLKHVLDGLANPTVQGPCTTPTYRFRDITLEKRLTVYKRILAKKNA
jgi:methionyl-tRNA formyltransferase